MTATMCNRVRYSSKTMQHDLVTLDAVTRFVDLSAPITATPPELPDLLRTDIEYSGHAEGAQTIDELPLEWFHAPGVVLDFSAREDGDAIDTADVQAELDRIGHTLAALDIVLVRTGRDAFYAELDYMARGPGVTADATRWLYEQGVRVMGIDA